MPAMIAAACRNRSLYHAQIWLGSCRHRKGSLCGTGFACGIRRSRL